MEGTSTRKSLKRPLPIADNAWTATKVRCTAEDSKIHESNLQRREWFANGQTSATLPSPSTLVTASTPSNGVASCSSGDDSDSDSTSSSESDLELDKNDTKTVWKSIFSQTDSVSTSSSNSLLAQAHQTTKHRQMGLQKNSFISSSTPSLGHVQPLVHSAVIRNSSILSLNRSVLFQITSQQKAPAVPSKVSTADDGPKPDEFLRKRLEKEGYSVRTFPSCEIPDFFLPVTEETVEGYDLDLVNKVRKQDVDGLRKLMQSGRNMQCSNQFGESIVHMACRREAVSVLSFLFEEAKVTCKLVCDSGRTPLHDACWTSVPNFEVIRMLLDRCPDLLYITDKRGFTPMNYVRHSNWASWNEFLGSYDTEKLIPKVLWN